MNDVCPSPNRLAEIIEIAVRDARLMTHSLHNTVIPALPSKRRAFATHIIRQLERGTFFDQDFLRDLEAFIDTLGRKIAEGTQIGWEADEHHVRGGWEVQYRDDCAAALARAEHELKSLHEAIARVLDAVQATRLAETLSED